jgi:putative hydrolase of the HAD superfamily
VSLGGQLSAWLLSTYDFDPARVSACCRNTTHALWKNNPIAEALARSVQGSGAMSIDSVWNGIEAIVFDAVGTLIEPSSPVADVYAAAAMRQRISLARSVVAARFRQHFSADQAGEDAETLRTDEACERRRWRRIVGDVMPELPDPESAFEELWAHFGRAEAWTCFDDVVPALQAIQKTGIPLGIGSNFDGRLRSVVTGLAELAPCSDALVISSEVGFRKPHPRFFAAVCERFRVPAERILVVGDDPHVDALGATRSGLRGLWLDRRGKGQSGDELRIGGLSEIVRIVGA